MSSELALPITDLNSTNLLASPDFGGTHSCEATALNLAADNHLRWVAAELDVVAEHVAPNISFTSLTDGDATVRGTLDVLSETAVSPGLPCIAESNNHSSISPTTIDL